MHTSREAYDRIRWDPRLDPTRFVIGYESRLPEPREVSFNAFVPDGDVPWHRVLYFREGDTIVWDRRTRVDILFDASPAHAAAVRSTPLAGAFFQPLPLHRFDRRAGAWTGALPSEPAREAPPIASVCLVTFNVLADVFADTPTDLASRLPALLAHLRAQDADVIALQEASPPLVRALLGERWVRDAYTVSDGPDGRTVDPHGVLLLMRLPVAQLVSHRFSRTKRTVLAEVRAGGVALQVAVVHLTSDRSPNAAATRQAHLDELCSALPPGGATGPATVVLGDFNWDDDALETAMARHGFTDAWRAVRPGDPGITFDAVRNALTARISLTKRSARLDRIFLRDGALALRPASAELFATGPVEGTSPELFPSDHFGVAVRAGLVPIASSPPAAVESPRAPASAVTGQPTYHTAVVIIPPAAVWPQIQAIRLHHDRHAPRWMPHVTLLYGFVPEDELARAFEIATRALAEVPPFEITLADIGTFAHRQARTVWARPEATPAGSLHALQAALERAFPRCDEQGRKSPAGFTPHLSLAQLEDRDLQAETLLSRWRAAWKALRFPVGEVALIARRGDEPFAVRFAVPLGPARPPDDPRDTLLADVLRDSDPSRQAEAAKARLVAITHLADACLAALPGDLGEGALHLTGAVRLGLAEAGGDVDAIAVGPDSVSRETFFEAAREWLVAAGGEASIAGDAVAPVLRGAIAGVAVDLGYAALPADLQARAPETMSPADLARLDPASRGSILAVRDAVAARAAVAARGAAGSLQLSLRALKRWARARGLYSNAFGFLSGFGWTLLAAWGVTRDGDPTAAAALARVFEVLGAGDPSRAVALTDDAAAYRPRSHEILVLPSPSAPSRNVARNVTRATAAVLRTEAARASRIVAEARRGEARWDALFEPYDGRAGSGARIDLSLRCEDDASAGASAGWVSGHVLGLLLDLETAGATRLRPDPRGMEVAGGITYTIALGDGPVDLAGARAAAVRFEQAFASWGSRPPGASIELTVRAG
jgi:poly(A) polymerase